MTYLNQNKGFTLIELVVAVSIIALLAIIAAPKFLNYSDDAERAQIEQSFAAFEGSIQLAHTRWLVSGGGTEAMLDLPGYAGGVLDINDVGYPIGIDKSPRLAAPYNIGRQNKACREIFEALIDNEYTFTTDSSQLDGADFYTSRLRTQITLEDQSTINANALCYYIYIHSSGYTNDPDTADLVYWYNSRNGQITTTKPDIPL